MSDNGVGSGKARPGRMGGHSGAVDGSGVVAELAQRLSGPAALAAGGAVTGVATASGQVAAVIRRGGFQLGAFADAQGGVWSLLDDGRKPPAGLCKRCLEAAAAAGSSLVVRE